MKLGRFVYTAIALLWLTNGASAATVATVNCSSISDQDLDWTSPKSIACPAFDSSLGRLTAVSLAFDMSYGSVYEVSATGGIVNGQVSAKGLASFGAGAATYVSSWEVDASPNSVRLYNGQIALNTIYYSGTKTWSSTDSPVLAYFATGAPSLWARASAQVITSAGLSDDYDFSAASLSTTATYTYQPAPEPASLGLLGAGLAGLVWRRRRRS